MGIHRITEANERKVEATIEELLRASQEHGFSSFMFIAEGRGRARFEGVVGRFRQEPLRAIGWLTLIKVKLAKLAMSAERGSTL